MPDVKGKIRHHRTAFGMTRKEYGAALGYSEAKIQNIELGKQKIDHVFLTQLHARFGLDLNELFSGEPVNEGMFVFDNDPPEATGGFVTIERLEVEASAGQGTAADGEDVSGRYAFNRKWIARRGLKVESLNIIAVKGDSMEPMLHDGDLILIDRDQAEPVDGRLFVARFDNDLFVKRLQRLPGDKLQLLSSNPVYPPLTVSLDGDDNINIVGRVVASMHEW